MVEASEVVEVSLGAVGEVEASVGAVDDVEASWIDASVVEA